jgi:hypothetical protein
MTSCSKRVMTFFLCAVCMYSFGDVWRLRRRFKRGSVELRFSGRIDLLFGREDICLFSRVLA